MTLDVQKSPPPTAEAGFRLLLQCRAWGPERGGEALRAWWELRTLDDAHWTEACLLAALAIENLELRWPQGARERLNGIRRYVAAANAEHLRLAMPLIDALQSADVPFLLLKDSARHALKPAGVAAGQMRAIDILVPADRVEEGNRAVLTAGYRPVRGLLPGATNVAALDRHHVSEDGHPRGFLLNVRRTALRLGRRGDFDNTLWPRARDAELVGRTVRVPSAADRFLMAIADAPMSAGAPALWVLDALDAASDATFDWDVVVAEARRRSLAVAVSAGLDQLEAEVQFDVPLSVRQALATKRDAWIYRKELQSGSGPRDARSALGRFLTDLAELSRDRGHRLAADGATTMIRGWPTLGSSASEDDILRAGAAVAGSGRPNVIELEISPADSHRRRPCFDLLLGGVWICRLVARRSPPVAALRPSAWRFRIPLRDLARISGADITGALSIVLLDESMLPLMTGRHDVRVRHRTVRS